MPDHMVLTANLVGEFGLSTVKDKFQIPALISYSQPFKLGWCRCNYPSIYQNQWDKAYDNDDNDCDNPHNLKTKDKK